MAAFINTNTASLNSQRNLAMSQAGLTTSLQRLSSGLRINSAKDDAAGLAISERMTSQIRGNDQAARNANDGISLAQTAEGDLSQIGTNLQRMRELAVQSANASNSASDRAALNQEAQQLSAEIDRVSSNSTFNGVKLLDGTFNAQTFQIGANGTANDRVTIDAIASARTTSLGGSGTSTASTVTGAVTTTALGAGDVTLNGFQIGASTVGSAPGQAASSAFSIANAINAVSAQSGVTATAVAASVTGIAPATPGALSAGSMSINGVAIGAIAAGGVLYVIASGAPGFDVSKGFASNGYGAHSPGGYSMPAALVTEVVMTMFFLIVILGATDRRAPAGFAPLPIGLALTLIHLISIPITNTSVNPARSTGVALYVGDWAVSQLWLFWVAPIAGAVLGALACRFIASEQK